MGTLGLAKAVWCTILYLARCVLSGVWLHLLANPVQNQEPTLQARSWASFITHSLHSSDCLSHFLNSRRDAYFWNRSKPHFHVRRVRSSSLCGPSLTCSIAFDPFHWVGSASRNPISRPLLSISPSRTGFDHTKALIEGHVRAVA